MRRMRKRKREVVLFEGKKDSSYRLEFLESLKKPR